MCNNNENACNCFLDSLCKIVKLQKQESCIDTCATTCNRPYLGANSLACLYNTRPITLYTCPNYTLWTMPYTLNEETSTSTVFRIEAVEDCCATFRVLAPSNEDSNTYTATESFFTINLNCIGSIKCLDDTFVACI